MHAPNGASFPNECIFRALEPGARLVVEHIVAPRYRLTVALSPRDAGQRTHLSWVQEFESPELAEKMRGLAGRANEEVLDRLAAELTRPSA